MTDRKTSGIDFDAHLLSASGQFKKKRIILHNRAVLGPRARAALEMATRWGMVQGYPDGEDSAGRAKLGLMPEADVVDRAIRTTEMLFDRFEALGWTCDPGEWEDEDEEEPEGESGGESGGDGGPG